jgi:hypothetical protein
VFGGYMRTPLDLMEGESELVVVSGFNAAMKIMVLDYFFFRQNRGQLQFHL